MTKQKKVVLEEKLKRNDLGIGMAYQRGIDVATRCFSQGLPILLNDQDMMDLKTCADMLKEQQLEANIYFGASGVLIGSYIAKLQEIYSNPSTIRQGLTILEKVYGSKVLEGSDLFESPYADQVERVKYFQRNKK